MERMNLLFLGKMPDSYEWSDGDKDASEDANEVWELAKFEIGLLLHILAFRYFRWSYL